MSLLKHYITLSTVLSLPLLDTTASATKRSSTNTIQLMRGSGDGLEDSETGKLECISQH